MFDFLQTIREGVKKNASDIHLASGNRPACRIDGEIRFCGGQALEAGDVEQCIKRCLDADRYERFRETGDADAAVELPDCGRFRLNAFRQNRGPALVLRVVGARTPELGELNLPESVNRILALKSGLVLVTGPTGSGKSTTLPPSSTNSTRPGTAISSPSRTRSNTCTSRRTASSARGRSGPTASPTRGR